MLKDSNSFQQDLPFPIYFVIKDQDHYWDDLLYSDDLPSMSSLQDRVILGKETCTILTYVFLKSKKMDVHLTTEFQDEQICVVSYDDLRIRDFPHNSFVVVCRADRPKPFICERCVQFNPSTIHLKTDFYMKMWPLFNLIPRNSLRKSKVENISFPGHIINLDRAFRSPSFYSEIQKLGMKLAISKCDLKNRRANWNDYKNVDVLLAVRNLTFKDSLVKPSPKLVNAWMAGCPAILGPESAFQDLRKTDLDYIEVRNTDQALKALRDLKNDHDLYQAMVINGLNRAMDYAPDIIAQDWVNYLSGPVVDHYLQWKKGNKQLLPLVRSTRFLYRSIMHKYAAYLHHYNIHYGDRILDVKTKR